jgi:hypothetical protein
MRTETVALSLAVTVIQRHFCVVRVPRRDSTCSVTDGAAGCGRMVLLGAGALGCGVCVRAAVLVDNLRCR